MKLENHLQQLTVKQRYIIDKISNCKNLILKYLLLIILCFICFVVIGMYYFETKEIKFLVLAILMILIPMLFLSSTKLIMFLVEKFHFLMVKNLKEFLLK
jgi:hypothetical protein